MMTTIILLICMYPFAFIMYYILKNEAKQKKGLYFGVKLSSEQASDERIKRIIEKYNRNMRCCFLFILLFPIVMLPVPWFSIAITIWMLWLIASMIIFFLFHLLWLIRN